LPTDSRADGQPRDPSGAAVRAVLQRAMAGDEPPIRPGIIGGAVRDARRARRWRLLAAASAVAVIGPAAVIGLSAIPGPAGAALPALNAGPVRISAARPAAVRPEPEVRQTTVTVRTRYAFVRPARPEAAAEADPEPITAQSLGQLLIDVLPAGARYSEVMASVGGGGNATGLSLANFDEVTTARGAGSVSVQLIRASKPGPVFDCGVTSVGEGCTTYRLGGGIEVNETVFNDEWEIGSTMLAVTVFRPAAGLISIEEGTGIDSPGTRPPLTLGQMVRAALDPRWGFTIGRAFLQQASQLQVGAANQG
jgi:hypothetical protein